MQIRVFNRYMSGILIFTIIWSGLNFKILKYRSKQINMLSKSIKTILLPSNSYTKT